MNKAIIGGTGGVYDIGGEEDLKETVETKYGQVEMDI